MKGLVRSLVISALLLFGAATASPAAAAEPVGPLQLALGDSWAFGVGAKVPSEGGYVAQLHEALQEDFRCLDEPDEGLRPGACPHLELLNIADGGETTLTLIRDQLPAAKTLLESRNGNLDTRDDVELITVHIGGNDIFVPILLNCQSPFDLLRCQDAIQTALTGYENNLNTALSTLRNDAGNDTTIVIGTYDNPFRFTPCVRVSGIPGVSVLADFVLEGDSGNTFQGLHDRMRTVAADPDVQAEVADAFGDLNREKDWYSSTQLPDERTDCLHPTQAGYDKVREAFLEALEQSE